MSVELFFQRQIHITEKTNQMNWYEVINCAHWRRRSGETGNMEGRFSYEGCAVILLTLQIKIIHVLYNWTSFCSINISVSGKHELIHSDYEHRCMNTWIHSDVIRRMLWYRQPVKYVIYVLEKSLNEHFLVGSVNNLRFQVFCPCLRKMLKSIQQMYKLQREQWWSLKVRSSNISVKSSFPVLLMMSLNKGLMMMNTLVKVSPVLWLKCCN